MTRSKRHILIAMLLSLLLGLSALGLPYVTVWECLSVASAWLCMFMLSAAMTMGPLRRIGGQASPVNIYIRRDLGIWAALLGLLHFYVGNVVAMNPVYVGKFVRGVSAPPGEIVRDQLFSWGSIAGTIVAILFLMLLAISSDRALHWLRPERWKKIQKTAHLALWLTVLHGFAYQVLEARWLPLALLLAVTLLVLGIQIRGRRKQKG
jgi:DMSO/TMAO reductase YedYZ heme-binding membrane subunit